MNARPLSTRFAPVLLALAAAAATAFAIYAYFCDQGINHTLGTMIVIGSSAAMLIAALIVGFVAALPRWLRGLLLVLVLLDIVATGLAAWFLEAPLLIAFMGVALLGWLLCVAGGGGRRLPERLPEPRAQPSAAT